MGFKDKIIDEIINKVNYDDLLVSLTLKEISELNSNEILENIVFSEFEKKINTVSKDKLIELYEYYVGDFEEFLSEYKIEEFYTNSSLDFGV